MSNLCQRLLVLVCLTLGVACIVTPEFQGGDWDSDGVPVEEDCDDENGNSTVVADDSDCDGVLTSADCDDGDPSTVNDMDCDGVVTAADCDDGDSSLLAVADDGDCDGVVTSADCDDSDPNQGVLCGVVLSSGTFTMGCTAGQSSCGSDESPAHSVTLTNDFWMGETEVTQGKWQVLMGNNPSYFSSCGSDCPVETVSWYEVLEFANAVSSAEGLAECYNTAGSSVSINSSSGSVYDCEGYRLPTEAEWEYAARAGTDLLYAGSNTIDDVAWYNSNSGNTTHAVATKAANAWGLYDMSGNVWEWTWDRYDSGYYSSSPSADPEGPSSGSVRVLRGGDWFNYASGTRGANRLYRVPDDRRYDLGFRLSRTIP